MNCSLDETLTLLAYCKTEVEKHKYKESDKILTIFTHFIIVSFYAEVEGCISDIIEGKINKKRSDDVGRYLSSALGRHRHNNLIKKIIDDLKKYGLIDKFYHEIQA